MINRFIEWFKFDPFFALFSIIMFSLTFIFAFYVSNHPSPKCAVGHYEERHGFILMNNIAVPTTYDAYVCDVWESK